MLKIEEIDNNLPLVVDEETGEIVSRGLLPKFENYNYFEDWKKDGLRFLEPMTCQTLESVESCKENLEEEYIAEEKFDGHRSIWFVTPKGNRFFSRRISKKTGWYSENTDCFPHFRDFKFRVNLNGTILDGEVTMPTGVFADVQGVTGALPERAIEKQIEVGTAIFNAFDILYHKGVKVQNMPLWKRKVLLAKVVKEMKCPNIKLVPIHFIKETEFITKMKQAGFPCIQVESFSALRDEMWEKGLEGLVIKKIDSTYQLKRCKEWLKVKEVNTYDVVIMGYQEPTKDYDGKTLREKGFWDYWEDYDDPESIFEKRLTIAEMEERNCAPITKPYAKGWIGAIICGLYKDGELVETTEVKGITDEMQEYIREHRDELIGTVIEVKAQGIIDKETMSLRHPRFNRWRDDKSAEECKWEEFGL